jgi:hypothetical protein
MKMTMKDLVTDSGGQLSVENQSKFLLIKLEKNKYIFVVETFCSKTHLKPVYYNPIVLGVGTAYVGCPCCHSHSLSILGHNKTVIINENDLLNRSTPKFAFSIIDRIRKKGGDLLLNHIFPNPEYMMQIIAFFSDEKKFWRNYPALNRMLDE